MIGNRRLTGPEGDLPQGPLRSVLDAVIAAFERCEQAGANPPQDLHADVREAAEVCPSLAIIVEE